MYIKREGGQIYGGVRYIVFERGMRLLIVWIWVDICQKDTFDKYIRIYIEQSEKKDMCI